jgi:hypothetical protein
MARDDYPDRGINEFPTILRDRKSGYLALRE